jgi:hypothetical protein
VPPKVQIPADSTDQKGDDVLVPLKDLLEGLNALGPAGSATGSALTSPSQGVAIIESGATALSKVWTTLVGALGGVTAITAVATRFWDGQQGGTRVAVVLATGAVIAAVAIALAVIVSADVRARGTGAAAIYDARSAIAVKFLEVSAAEKPAPPKPAAPASTESVHQQLLLVKDLRDQGLITDDEVAEMKAKILGT